MERRRLGLGIPDLRQRRGVCAHRCGRLLYLGEFGTYAASVDSRALWTAAVARQAERHGMSRAYFDFGSACGAYDVPRAHFWRPQLLDALMPH
jgi:endoglucanase